MTLRQESDLTPKELNKNIFKQRLEKARTEDIKLDKSSKILLLIVAITLVIIQ